MLGGKSKSAGLVCPFKVCNGELIYPYGITVTIRTNPFIETYHLINPNPRNSWKVLLPLSSCVRPFAFYPSRRVIMGVIGKLLAKLNAFDPKRDGFAGTVTDESEQTRLGAFLSVVILPVCVAAYSALYFVQFYYGFGESAPPLYKVTTSETLQYGNQVKELALECTNPYGCFFRLPAGGASMCQSGVVSTEQPNNDFCDTSSPAGGGNAPNVPAQGAGRKLLDDEYPWRAPAARSLLEVAEPKCSGKIACGTFLFVL